MKNYRVHPTHWLISTQVLIYLKMGPTTPPPAGWNWDAPPLPARPSPAAPRGSAAHKAASWARAPTAPQLEAAKGLYEYLLTSTYGAGCDLTCASSTRTPAPTPADFRDLDGDGANLCGNQPVCRVHPIILH